MDKALPIVFLNLSGEMLYVIQQRLDAQNISLDKSAKVIQDILSTMLNEQFMEELFKPQKMYARAAMRTVFDKLVHSSIMRLNPSSMGKLYDLMLMVFKYQVVNCDQPENLLLVTLNHLDAIKNCAKPYPELLKKVENLHSLLISNYKDLPHEDYDKLYKCITVFLQDLNIRVSVLMKLGLQLQSGEIIKQKCETNEDGETINKHIFDSNEDISALHLTGTDKKVFPDGCLDFDGDRQTTLGTNIYIKPLPSETPENKSLPEKLLPLPVAVETNKENESFQALEELSLLGRLIGKCNQPDVVPEIILASPDDDVMDNMHNALIKDNCTFVNINAQKVCQQELGKISNELYVNKEEREKSDILELLDIAENADV